MVDYYCALLWARFGIVTRKGDRSAPSFVYSDDDVAERIWEKENSVLFEALWNVGSDFRRMGHRLGKFWRLHDLGEGSR